MRPEDQFGSWVLFAILCLGEKGDSGGSPNLGLQRRGGYSHGDAEANVW